MEKTDAYYECLIMLYSSNIFSRNILFKIIIRYVLSKDEELKID